MRSNLFKSIFNIIIVSLSLIDSSSSQLRTFTEPQSLGKRIISPYNFLNEKGFHLYLKQRLYLNTNLPNLENLNGSYAYRGHGGLTSAFLGFNSNNFSITIEPLMSLHKIYDIKKIEKKDVFSVLNDLSTPPRNINKIKNAGIELKYNSLSFGYGNWNRWWGPGIHNSISLSNNAEGFYHYFVENYKYLSLTREVKLKGTYIVSTKMKNSINANFYFSGLFLVLKMKNYEIGVSRSILNGGYPDLNWSNREAFFVILSNKNLRYWDTINDYYFKIDYPKSGLELFLNIAIPNRSFSGENESQYSFHANASNIGIRKKGVFDNDKLEYGIEYTRLIQGNYYNILPTPNWYDNFKFNYSSYNNRRWGAHSGSDSDDFLLYFGYNDNVSRLYFGINYERHGVTYHFPPEVKIEFKSSFSLTRKNLIVSVEYENEYFEHYGFVDNNKNVWNQTFEDGSIQRTSTILFSITNKQIFK